MGITVLKKDDGYWLSFESSTGKWALVPVTKLMPLPGIATRAVLSTCEELSVSPAQQATGANSVATVDIAVLEDAIDCLSRRITDDERTEMIADINMMIQRLRECK